MGDPVADLAVDRPTVSVLIEWENVVLSAEDRSAVLLRTLRDQSREVDARFEFLFCYNPEQVDREGIEQAIEANLRGPGLPEDAIIRVEAVVGKHYYALRNHAATVATGELLLCADSDILPEPGWIRAMLDHAMASPQHQVVAGRTHLDPAGLVGKAFAAGWIFEPRSEDDSTSTDKRHFWANNVLFRRSCFLSHPYEEHTATGETRNACRRLAERLVAEGIEIHTVGAARAAHPPPNGLRHCLIRGLAEGRDHGVYWASGGKGRVRRLLRSPAFAWSRFRKSLVRGVRDRRTIGASVLELPMIWLIMGGYSLLLVAGAWAHCLFPARAGRAWRL